MSNEFLSTYTIPLLPNNAAAQPVYVEEIPQQTVLTTPIIAANFNRYFPAGKQEPGKVLPTAPASRPPKRKIDSIADGNKSEFFTGRDESYPEELNELIKPLFCELCSVKINSPKSAKDHYESKAHDKKLTAWIAHRYPENPPAIKRFVYEPRVRESGLDPQHCKACDLKLTSLVHAKQHYSGRKHNLVISNISNPSGTGYYNAEGKWVRTGSKLKNDQRFSIGVSFQATKIAENSESSTNVENIQLEIKSPSQPLSTMAMDDTLCCKICKISVTSAPQMKTHIEGARHRKNLARLSIDPNAESVTSTNSNNASDSLLNIVKNSITTANSNDDYSMYRTPSGSYYCQNCNMSMTSVAALQQHIQGKKHIKMLADQKLNDAKLAKSKVK